MGDPTGCGVCGNELLEDPVWCEECGVALCGDCDTPCYEAGEENSGWGPGLHTCPEHAPEAVEPGSGGSHAE